MQVKQCIVFHEREFKTDTNWPNPDGDVEKINISTFEELDRDIST